MPRPRSHDRDALAAAAMAVFWSRGFEATSVDDLVRATGVARHGIYGDFGGKRALFLAGLDAYRRDVVDPAFAPVEAEDGRLDAVAGYFETQIARAEAAGLPGPGCLFANAAAELAARDPEIRARVAAHDERLRRGFAAVLGREAPRLPETARSALAAAAAVFAQGLWSASRTAVDAAPLRRAVRAFLDMLDARIAP